MSYAYTCTIQAKEKYKGQSRGNHMAITWKLRDHVSSQFIVSCYRLSMIYVTLLILIECNLGHT